MTVLGTEMEDEEFRALVDVDLRRRSSSEEAAYLRSPDVVERWHTTLLSISKSVEGRLSADRQDFEAAKERFHRDQERIQDELDEAEDEGANDRIDTLRTRLAQLRSDWSIAKERYSRSRGSALRFKSGLDEWIIEARGRLQALRPGMYDTLVATERNHLAERVRELENAIRDHRENTLRASSARSADETLWSQVDE